MSHKSSFLRKKLDIFFKPLFKHLNYIDQKYIKKHYMYFTINGLPHELEKRNPAIDFAVRSAELNL